MTLLSTIKYVAFLSLLTFPFSTRAAERKVELNEASTVVTFQVTSTKQIQQDEVLASFKIEKSDLKSDNLQTNINIAIRAALDLSKKYSDVKTSTGRYFVYKDEQKDQWKGSQTLLLDSFSQNSIAQFAGELQKNGFTVDNYSYTLSEKSRRSLDDGLRLELMQKATQIATNVIAKGLNKKFIRFAQIDFNSQNYYPVAALRSFSAANANANISSNPAAQSGLSDVQMSANINAIFGK